MDQMTYVRTFRIHKTTVQWSISNWAGLTDLKNFHFCSKEFRLKQNRVKCRMELRSKEDLPVELILSVGPHEKAFDLEYTFFVVTRTFDRHFIVVHEIANLEPTVNYFERAFTIKPNLDFSKYGKYHILTFVCAFQESVEDLVNNVVNSDAYEDVSAGSIKDVDTQMSDFTDDDTYVNSATSCSTISNDDDESKDDVEASYMNKRVLDNYDIMYSREDLCDLALNFSDTTKVIMCHSFVLATLSPYLACLIKRTRTGYYNLRQIDLSSLEWLTHDLFQSFLEYAYGMKSVSDLHVHVYHLLLLAVRFQVNILQNDCEDYLRRSLCLNNVMVTLRTANLHCMNELKADALHFARQNYDVLKRIGKISRLKRDEPDLYEELIEGIVDLYYT